MAPRKDSPDETFIRLHESEQNIRSINIDASERALIREEEIQSNEL